MKTGARGLIKDIIIVILGYQIFRAWLMKEIITVDTVILTLIVFTLSTWFILERVGLA